MKSFVSAALRSPAFPPLVLTASLLAGLLVGIEPVGGDPDRLYRPIKAELARALSEGRLPFWTDGLGTGVPLIAESHAAAFYPLNGLLYRILPVSAAYRFLMWFHYLVLVGATFVYARRLEIGPSGAAVAALAFGFCGFQSIHSSHEVFYHALAFLPVCLYLAERFLDEGRAPILAWLAIAFALQLSLGHFQIQSWTAGLVAITGACRLFGSPRRFRRAFGLLAGLAWGGAIAAVQLGASGELARFVGFDRRSFADLAFYGFPPAHWVELFVPTLFRGIPGGPESPYWYAQGTTGYEACFYIGTIPLLLAVVGLVSGGGAGSGILDRGFRRELPRVDLAGALAPGIRLGCGDSGDGVVPRTGAVRGDRQPWPLPGRRARTRPDRRRGTKLARAGPGMDSGGVLGDLGPVLVPSPGTRKVSRRGPAAPQPGACGGLVGGRDGPDHRPDSPEARPDGSARGDGR